MRMIIIGLAAAVLGGQPVLAQEAQVSYLADDIIRLLRPAPKTRSLIPGEGKRPTPGTPGSGIIPDINVLFEFNSANLTELGEAQLDELGKAIISPQLEAFAFLVGGHTDAVGKDTYNKRLSEKRAQAVVSYLTDSKGVEQARLTARGYGESEFADPDDPNSAKNRRVEIRTMTQ